MLTLLTKPEFQRRALPVSVAAWHSMIAHGLAPQRAELIRGVILEKWSKSILHSKLTSRLLRILEAAAGDVYWIRKEDPLTFADSEPEPDLSVAPGREEDYIAHPTTATLVVEVAVTTLHEDRELISLYAEASVSEYWIVNAPERCIEVYREPAAGAYTIAERASHEDVLHCASLPSVSVPVRELFANLPTLEEAREQN